MTASALALAAALTLGAPLAASAHVHVDPSEADAGAAEAVLTFAVPNESDTETTTAVSIMLPTGTPFETVSAEPVDGWTVTKSAKRVKFVADGDGIGASEEQEFVLTVGPVPDVDSIPMPVAQTYSDGEVVRWDEATPASGEEPERPAPVVYVNADAAGAHGEEHAAATDEEPEAAPVTTSATSADGTGVAALVLSGTALVVALIAAVLGGVALARGSRTRG